MFLCLFEMDQKIQLTATRRYRWCATPRTFESAEMRSPESIRWCERRYSLVTDRASVWDGSSAHVLVIVVVVMVMVTVASQCACTTVRLLRRCQQRCILRGAVVHFQTFHHGRKATGWGRRDGGIHIGRWGIAVEKERPIWKLNSHS